MLPLFPGKQSHSGKGTHEDGPFLAYHSIATESRPGRLSQMLAVASNPTHRSSPDSLIVLRRLALQFPNYCANVRG